jgi:hypothetical protein
MPESKENSWSVPVAKSGKVIGRSKKNPNRVRNPVRVEQRQRKKAASIKRA